MSFEELFRDFWWLIFPIFGMGMGLWGMASYERRSRGVMDLIKTYADQGKEPPPELLRLATQDVSEAPTPSGGHSNLWSFVVFAGLAAGFGAGYYLTRGEGYSFAFAIVAVAMGVMAVGALLILIVGRK